MIEMTLDSIRKKPNVLIGILILYFTVGILLFSLERTRPLFSTLTPWSLMLSFAAILIFQKEWSLKTGYCLPGGLLWLPL